VGSWEPSFRSGTVDYPCFRYKHEMDNIDSVLLALMSITIQKGPGSNSGGGSAASHWWLPRDALVHSAVLRLHVVRPSVRLSVRLSVCDVGVSGIRIT